MALFKSLGCYVTLILCLQGASEKKASVHLTIAAIITVLITAIIIRISIIFFVLLIFY